MGVEPHVTVFRGICPECGSGDFHVVAVPKLSTGEHFPQFGTCEACKAEVDLADQPPIVEVVDE